MKALSKEQQEEMKILAKEKYNNHYDCDLYGRFPWTCERHGREQDKMKTVSLSKSSLGTFTYEVLRRGGDIYSWFVMWPKDDRSAVFPMVKLTLVDRDDMVQQTGFVLNPPAVVKIN